MIAYDNYQARFSESFVWFQTSFLKNVWNKRTIYYFEQ